MRALVVFILLVLFSDAQAQNLWGLPGAPKTNYDQVVDAFGGLVAPRNPPADLYLRPRQSYYIQHKYDPAVDYIKQRIKIANDTGYTACLGFERLGKMYWQMGTFDSAMHFYKKATELDHDGKWVSGRCYADMGAIDFHLSNLKKATDESNKAIQANLDSESVCEAKNTLIWILNYRKNKDGLLDSCRKLIEQYITDPAPHFIMGMEYLRQGNYDSAKFYLQNAYISDNDQSWVTAWAHVRLGEIYIKEGIKEKAIEQLKIAILADKTRTSVRYAQKLLDSLGYKRPGDTGSMAPNWVKIEGEHIRYYFQDTANMSALVNNYMKEHEEAYIQINSTFQAVLPKKLVFYVWNDRELAKKILGYDLGLTDPEICTTNASIDQTIGHEMANTLSYWAWGLPPVYRVRFIDEGVATAFDQSSRDRYEMASKAVAGKNIGSVLDIWKDESTDDGILYPAGGAFMEYMYQKSTPEQFKNLIKDQTIESAEKIYGKVQFDQLIADFDKIIGLRTPIDSTSSEPDWVTIEGGHIRYYFRDTTGKTQQVNDYIKQHEEAYEKINRTFEATLPRKMVFYVWNSQELTKQLLGQELGITNPETCTTNAYIGQTIGFEMTQTLSYWGWGLRPIHVNRFINDGVAVAFDQSNRDKFKIARKAIAGQNIHSVLDVWEEENTDESLVHSLGGAFLTYLYRKSTTEQFKQLIKDQTIENAKKIYGKVQFNQMITDFNQLIALR